MADPAFVGLSAIWGCKTGVGEIVFAGIVVSDKGKLQSAKGTREGEKAYVANEEGASVARSDYNLKRTYDITVSPTADSIANAKLAAASLCPDPGTVVTITDPAFNASAIKYQVNTATINRSNTGYVTVDMSLEHMDGITYP